MAQQIPDPATNVSPADIQPTTKERVLKGLGGFIAGGSGANTQQLDDVIATHHQKRLDEAKMHRQNASTYAGVLATGFDPKTGQKLSPEQEAQYQNWYETSWAAYEKAAGVSKDTKGALQRAKMIVEHLIGRGKQQREEQAPQGQPPPSGGGMTPPPSANAAPASPATSGGAAPKPGMAPPPKYDNQAAMAAPALRQDIADTHDINMKSREARAAFDQRGQFAEEVGLQPGTLGYQEYKATGRFPAQAHLQKAIYMDPKDPTHTARDGSYDPSSGQYIDQKGNPVEGALPASVSSMNPKPFKYMLNGKVLPGFQVGTKYYDMEMNELPAGTELYQRGLLPTETYRQVITYDPVTGDPKINTLETVHKPITDVGKTNGKGTDSGPSPKGGMTPPPKASTPSAPQAGKDATGKPLGMSAGMYNQQVNRAIPTREAITQILGDPEHPDYQSLKNFAHLADSTESQKRLGKAFELTFGGLEQKEKAHGSLITLAQAYLEVPQALAEAKAGIMQDVISKLTPDEQAAYDRTITAFSTAVGFRALTKGSAAKFSVEALERDVPMIGVNTTNTAEFNRKLAGLAVLANNGARNISDSILGAGMKDYLKRQVDELSRSGSGRGGLDKPPKAGAASSIDDEIIGAINKAKPKARATAP